MGLYSEEEKTSAGVQSTAEVVTKLQVEQQHHLQDSALYGLFKTSATFINAIFLGTKFSFAVIKFSKINGSLHYFCQAWECYSKYILTLQISPSVMNNIYKVPNQNFVDIGLVILFSHFICSSVGEQNS